MATNLPRLPGVREADCAQGVGPRLMQHRAHLVSNQLRNINLQPIGGAASAAVTTFTPLTLAAQANPYCGTLVAHITQASAVAGTFQLRIKGFDHFARDIATTTPIVTLAAKTNNYVYLPHTMAYISSVEFVSTGLDIAGDTISLGQRWDWTRTIDGTNEHLHGRNLGIAVPMRLAQRRVGEGTGRTFDRPKPANEPYFAMNLSNNIAPNLTHDFYQSAQGFARAMFVFIANASNTDTMVCGTITYTFNTVLGGANSIFIGATKEDTAENLSRAISAAPNSGEGTLYGTGTEPNPDAVSEILPDDEFVAITAKDDGARGNLIIATSSMTGGSGYTMGTGHFVSGFDGPVEVTNVQVTDQTGLVTVGSITHFGADEFSVGDNDDGWEGPVEKIHILFQTAVAQWAITDDVFVDLTVASLETAIQ